MKGRWTRKEQLVLHEHTGSEEQRTNQQHKQQKDANTTVRNKIVEKTLYLTALFAPFPSPQKRISYHRAAMSERSE